MSNRWAFVATRTTILLVLAGFVAACWYEPLCAAAFVVGFVSAMAFFGAVLRWAEAEGKVTFHYKSTSAR